MDQPAVTVLAPPLDFELVFSDGEPLETEWHSIQLPFLRELIHKLMKERGRTDFYVGVPPHAPPSPPVPSTMPARGSLHIVLRHPYMTALACNPQGHPLYMNLAPLYMNPSLLIVP